MPKASMDPVEERPATRAEDHPLEYAEFEGVIPVGQYGVGTVIVWRTGTYDPQNSIPPDKQHALGKIGVGLRGVELRGSFTLNSNPKAVRLLSAKEALAPHQELPQSRASRAGCLSIFSAPAAGSALIARILMVVRADVSGLHIDF